MPSLPPYPYAIQFGARPLFATYLLPFFPALWWGLERGSADGLFSFSLALFLLLSLLLLLRALIQRKPFIGGWWAWCVLPLLMLCLGFTLGSRAHRVMHANYPLKGYNSLAARVVSAPRVSGSGITSCLVCPLARYDTVDAKWYPLPSAELRLAIRDSARLDIKPFDCLLLDASFTPFVTGQQLPEVLNPNAFSYEQWLLRKGVRGMLWAKSSTVSQLAESGQRELPLVYRLRAKALARLAAHDLSPDAYALSASLAVAQRDTLSSSIRDAFAAVGIVHILALSGLHVGMIYAIFSRLMRGISLRTIWHRLLRKGFPLLMVWLFVAFVGVSSSLLRAAIMLSAYVVPSLFFRRLHRLDVFLLAAFIILLRQPCELYDAGFQLSFSAVAGIMLFSMPLQRGVHANEVRGWVGYVGRLLCVSMAAQLGTTPFVLLYFGRLPLVALLLNLLAIPLVSLLLPMAFALILLPPIPWFTQLLALIQNFAVWLLVSAADFFANLPFVELRGIRIDALGSLCLALALLFVGWVIVKPRSRWWIIPTLCAFLPFAMLLMREFQAVKHTDEVVVFHQNRSTLLAYRQGLLLRLFSRGEGRFDSLILRDYTSNLFSTSIEDTPPWDAGSIESQMITLADGSLLRMPSRMARFSSSDYCLITKALEDSVYLLDSIPHPALVIVDGSVRYAALQRWEKACAARGIPLWNTRAQGAFILKVKGNRREKAIESAD